jgi:hypothetical protein
MPQNRYVLYLFNLKISLVKRFTLFVFFLLPHKLTSVFVSLSLLSLIFSLREENLEDDKDRLKRLSRMLNVHVDKNIMLLPEKTMSWYWTDEVMQSTLTTVQGNQCKVRDILADNTLFMTNRNAITNYLLDSLPKSITVKLALNVPENRVQIKHNLTSVLMYH